MEQWFWIVGTIILSVIGTDYVITKIRTIILMRRRQKAFSELFDRALNHMKEIAAAEEIKRKHPDKVVPFPNNPTT